MRPVSWEVTFLRIQDGHDIFHVVHPDFTMDVDTASLLQAMIYDGVPEVVAVDVLASALTSPGETIGLFGQAIRKDDLDP